MQAPWLGWATAQAYACLRVHTKAQHTRSETTHAHCLGGGTHYWRVPRGIHEPSTRGPGLGDAPTIVRASRAVPGEDAGGTGQGDKHDAPTAVLGRPSGVPATAPLPPLATATAAREATSCTTTHGSAHNVMQSAHTGRGCKQRGQSSQSHPREAMLTTKEPTRTLVPAGGGR